MHVKENLWTPDLWMPYTSKVKVELFDERTGKLQDQVEGENYPTDWLTNGLKWYTRRWISARCGMSSPINPTATDSASEWIQDRPNTVGYGITYADYPPNLFPGSVALTGATHAEDPTNDRYVRGALIAWAQPESWAVTGTDTRRGGLNIAECSIANNKCIFVFDWTTPQGNGTMQSVYWAYVNYSANAYNYVSDLFFQNATSTGYGSITAGQFSGISGFGSVPPERGLCLDPDGVSYWTATANATTTKLNLVKRTISTGALVTTVVVNNHPNYSNVMGLCQDGTGSLGNFWAWDTAGFLVKIPAAGGNIISSTTYTTLGIPSPGGGATGITCAFFYYNGYLWCASAGKMYQVLASGPTLAATVTLAAPAQGALTSTSQTGLYYPDSTNGDELWLSVASTQWFRYDLSGNFRGSFVQGSGVGANQGASLYPYGGNQAMIMSSSQYTGTSPFFFQTNYVVSGIRQFGARSLLPSPVTKSNTQTMKLTYEFDFT